MDAELEEKLAKSKKLKAAFTLFKQNNLQIDGKRCKDIQDFIVLFQANGIAIDKSRVSFHLKPDRYQHQNPNQYDKLFRVLEPKIKELGYVFHVRSGKYIEEEAEVQADSNSNERLMGLCGVWLGHYWSSENGIVVFKIEIIDLENVIYESIRSRYKGFMRLIPDEKFYIEATGEGGRRKAFFMGDVGPFEDLTKTKGIKIAYVNSGVPMIKSGLSILIKVNEEFESITLMNYPIENINPKIIEYLQREKKQFKTEFFYNRDFF